jgi:hypothetical protein
MGHPHRLVCLPEASHRPLPRRLLAARSIEQGTPEREGIVVSMEQLIIVLLVVLITLVVLRRI